MTYFVPTNEVAIGSILNGLNYPATLRAVIASKGFPSGYSKSVRVSACTQKAPNLRFFLPKRCPTNTRRRRCLDTVQLSSLYPTSPSFSSFDGTCVMWCCLPPASSSSPLRPSVYYPSILRPFFPPSSSLPRFLLPPLPHFLRPASLPPSLPPHCPSSISPLHPGGSGRVAKHAARMLFPFDSRTRCLLVS